MVAKWFGKERLRAAAFLLFLVLGLCLVVGAAAWMALSYFYPPTVEITVDNNLDNAVVVAIDGREAGQVAPGTTLAITCRHGERQLRVTKGDDTVFAFADTLRAPDQKGTMRKYLLNLGRAGRYRAYDVQYGFFPQLNMPGIRIRSPWETEQDRRREEVRELAEKVKFVELPEWSDVTQYDVVLERPPKKVEGALTASKKVLAKITPADHALVRSAAAKKEPTAVDVAEVRAAVERLLRDEGPGE